MTEANYEGEQGGFQESDGTNDIEIVVPKDPEVDPVVYNDVEQLLFRGFLVRAAEINESAFVFKSLNHHEFEMIRWMSGLHDQTLVRDQFYNAFLSYGVFMVAGTNILPERERWLPMLSEMFSSMPAKAKTKLVWNLSEINRKAANATTLTEAYSMESYSRFRWAQLKGLDLMSTATTGILGTEKLGMNIGQLTWRALNYYEDLKETTEREWEHAKFVGSCMVGKGLSKIYNSDRDRRRKEHEERVSRKDKLLRQVLLGQTIEATTIKNGQLVVAANTVEELAAQLERDLKGEKDWHDQVVADYENRVRSAMHDRRQELARMSQEREKEFNGKMLRGSTDMTGLTPEEVQQRIERRRQVNAQNLATRVVHPEVQDPHMASFLDKWAPYEDEGVRTSVSGTERDTSEATPLKRAEPRAVPFRRT